MNIIRQNKIARLALIAAAGGGLAVAFFAAEPLKQRQISLTAGAIAQVNNAAIDRAEYGVALAALTSDKSKTPTAADKRLALDRLIEEELLVQRGLEIGLADSDASVRKAIAAAVIEFVLAQNKHTAPSEQELRKYYAANKSRFAAATRLYVKRIYVTRRDKVQTVRAALQAGETFDAVAQKYGEPHLPQLPQTQLPYRKLYDYLSPRLTDAARRMQSGDISDAIRHQDGWHFIYLVERGGGTAPPFAEIRAQLATAFLRERDDDSLRDYLDWLRNRAAITLANDAPAK